MSRLWHRAISLRFSAVSLLLLMHTARADNFGKVYYDRKSDQLVITMIYRGSNPNHAFSLKWDRCQTDASGVAGVTVVVLDDQFEDLAQNNYKKTVRFGLANVPSRPVNVTLRTAPRFFRIVMIP